MNVDVITREDLDGFKSELIRVFESKLDLIGQRHEFLTGEEVKELLDISTGTLQNYRIRGILNFAKVEGKIFYLYADVQKMIYDRLQAPRTTSKR